LGNRFSKPEEIAHSLLFSINEIASPEIILNLRNSALRIEKQGSHIRFLYAGGEMKNSAFREIAHIDFEMEPKYVGVFALKGFVTDSLVVPVYFDLFTITNNPCP
jgi:hypothetical protein